MASVMHMVAAAIGAVLLLFALVAFFRSFWRSPPKRERDEWSPDGMPGGAQGPDASSGGHGDGGGHA
jgi:hypothetical protein